MAVLDQSKKPYIQDRDEKQFIGIDLSFTRSEGIEGWFKSTETTLDPESKFTLKSLASPNDATRYKLTLFSFCLLLPSESTYIELDNCKFKCF